MTARAAILARIRAQLGKQGSAPGESETASLIDYLKSHPQGPRPNSDWLDLAARFTERAQAMGTSVDEIKSLDPLPAAVARYLEARKLPKAGVCWPQLADLRWSDAGVALESRAADKLDLLGVTGAFCGIAETGTLMLLSGAATPATVSLLPETHIAALPVSRIVKGMEEAWDLLRREYGRLPRAVNFVSGPSRTADIEQTIVIGAHGPYRVHIVLVR
ncbi:MAG: lactate utilization protein C [Burkholderiales bacterium]|nr:lactate utilization protein C [Burkholderiales bacterium]